MQHVNLWTSHFSCFRDYGPLGQTAQKSCKRKMYLLDLNVFLTFYYEKVETHSKVGRTLE